MNLLFALSQIEVTGAETYALALAQALHKRDHRVTFVSDSLRQYQPHTFIPLPLHSGNTSYWMRWQNVKRLRQILKQEKIDVIHSHSRAANLISHFAAGNVPMVVSVHGRWRNHFAFRALPCLGQKTLAVCPYLQRYLVQDIGIDPKRVAMIPNGINTDLFIPAATTDDSTPTALFVGRFSGQKGNCIRFLIKYVFPLVVDSFKNLNIVICSSLPSAPDQTLIDQFNAAHGNVLRVVAPKGLLTPYYQKATVVIGSGRVAMESLACGKPVIALGESCAPGLLNADNFESAFDSNFGDCGPWNLFLEKNNLVANLKQILSDTSLQKDLSVWGRQKALAFFDADKISQQIESIYKSL